MGNAGALLATVYLQGALHEAARQGYACINERVLQ